MELISLLIDRPISYFHEKSFANRSISSDVLLLIDKQEKIVSCNLRYCEYWFFRWSGRIGDCGPREQHLVPCWWCLRQFCCARSEPTTFSCWPIKSRFLSVRLSQMVACTVCCRMRAPQRHRPASRYFFITSQLSREHKTRICRWQSLVLRDGHRTFTTMSSPQSLV